MDQDAIDDMPDVSLIDNEIAPAPDQPSETATPGEPAADTEEKSEQTEQTTEGDEQPGDKPQETQPNDEAERRRQNAEAAARRVQNRARVKQEVAQQLDQTYGPKSQEELQAEGYNARDAQIEALRQEMAYERQRTQIAELNASMQSDAVNIMNDFEVFNPNSKSYDPEFTQMVEQQYRLAARLQTDENGIILNAEVPIYDYYRDMATIYQRGTSRGAQQGQSDALSMMARTEDPGGSSTTNKGDDLDDLEERLGNMVIT